MISIKKLILENVFQVVGKIVGRRRMLRHQHIRHHVGNLTLECVSMDMLWHVKLKYFSNNGGLVLNKVKLVRNLSRNFVGKLYFQILLSKKRDLLTTDW